MNKVHLRYALVQKRTRLVVLYLRLYAKA